MKKLTNRRIQKQWMSVIVLSSVIPLLLLSFFSVYFINRSANQQMRNRINDTLTSADELLTREMIEQEVMVEQIASEVRRKFLDDHEVTESTYKELRVHLFQQLLSKTNTQNIYVVFNDGMSIGTSNLPTIYDLPSFQHWGIYRMANQTEELVLYSNEATMPDTLSHAYTIAKRVTLDANRTAYVLLDASTEHVQNILNTVKGTSFGYIQFVIALDGDRVVYNDSSFRSPVSYLQNIFRYDRFDADENTKAVMRDMTLGSKTNMKKGYTIYGMIPNDMIRNQASHLSLWLSVFIAFTGIITFIIGFKATGKVTDPIVLLANRMAGVKPNDDVSYPQHLNEVDALSSQFDHLMMRLDHYHESHHQKLELLRIAELKALMSQLNPHFLNNTLDSIKWKSKMIGADDIADMATQLGMLLQVSLKPESFVRVEDELKFVESYIKIQKYRYGNAFSYRVNVADDLMDVLIPKLILQPLVENAIIHGLEPKGLDGILEINGWKEADTIFLEVIDNGVGSLFQLNSVNDSQHVGLKNVQSRLKLHYDHRFTLLWESTLNIGTCVRLSLPKEELNA